VADTVAVLYKGEIACTYPITEASPEKIGYYMVGANHQEAQ
jgi:ABC-type sugar transport system ATPase subunit